MTAVNTAQFLIETDVAGRHVVRARVSAVHEDGSVTAATDGDARRVRCDVLQTGEAASLRLAERDAVLVWLPGPDDERGVVLGRIGPSHAPEPDVTRDPEPAEEIPDELVLEAKENLTLKCGDGSITLRADGKILIKGKDLVSHAQRVNRIKGGAVSIN